MRFDIYARVSTDDQNVYQQVQHLRNWVIKNQHEIASETFDDQSGKVDLKERTKFLELLNNPKGDAMLILNLDRLTRNWDSVTFIEKHFRENWDTYKLVSAGDEVNLTNANGRFMFRVKMAMNCYMPEDMLEKQTIGIERAKKEGKYKGRKKGAVSKKNGN
jgi:DNA invertase Pin-like site-specific DNA recombinase